MGDHLLPTPIPEPGVPTKIPVLSLPDYIKNRGIGDDISPKKNLTTEQLQMLDEL